MVEMSGPFAIVKLGRSGPNERLLSLPRLFGSTLHSIETKVGVSLVGLSCLIFHPSEKGDDLVAIPIRW
jgi:hypothetical protein